MIQVVCYACARCEWILVADSARRLPSLFRQSATIFALTWGFASQPMAGVHPGIGHGCHISAALSGHGITVSSCHALTVSSGHASAVPGMLVTLYHPGNRFARQPTHPLTRSQVRDACCEISARTIVKCQGKTTQSQLQEITMARR